MNPLSKPRLIFLLLAILATFLAHAQAGPGYIILNEGDTLRGEVQLKQGYPGAPRIVGFAGTESAAPANFSVDECKGFCIGNNVYQRATVTMDMSHLANIDLIILNEDILQTQTVFLRQLFKGKYFTLLHYYDGDEEGFFQHSNIKRHFFINNGDSTMELVMKYQYASRKDRGLNVERGSWAIRQVRPIFRDQLKLYYDWMNDRRLRKKIDASLYREDHLIKIIKEIDSKYRPPVN